MKASSSRTVTFWYNYHPGILGLIVALSVTAIGNAGGLPENLNEIFGAVLSFASIVVGVLLGFLALLVSIDSREIIQEIRKGPYYRQLVNFASVPLASFLVLSFISLIAFLLPKDPTWPRILASAVIFFLVTSGLLATYRFSRLLSYVLTAEKEAPDADEQRRIVEGADERAGEDSLRRDERTASADTK
jgi:hypothetical protein